MALLAKILYLKKKSQLEFTDYVNAPIGWGFLLYEILALGQFSSEYVRRVKTRNFVFFTITSDRFYTA
jgi:hypothetical protein